MRIISRYAALAVSLFWLLILALISCPAAWASTRDSASPGEETLRWEHSLEMREWPIRIAYSGGEEKVARRIAEICREMIPELGGQIGLEGISPIHIYLLAEMRPYSRISGNDLPSWGIAFALMGDQVMLVDVKRATSAWNSLEKVIPHELSHLLLAQRVGPVAMPLWFVEGLAQWQAHQWSILESWRLMDAVWSGRAPRLARLAAGYPRDETLARDAYRISYAAFLYLFEERMDQLPAFLEEISRARSFDDAFAGFWQEDLGSFSARFQADIEERYSSYLLIFQTGPLFTILAVVFLFIYFAVKLRSRRKLARLDRWE